jgi:hypothetical protein
VASSMSSAIELFAGGSSRHRPGSPRLNWLVFTFASFMFRDCQSARG